MLYDGLYCICTSCSHQCTLYTVYRHGRGHFLGKDDIQYSCDRTLVIHMN